jgi:hypothetical protein
MYVFAVGSDSHNAQLYSIITLPLVLTMNLETLTSQCYTVPIVF